jgi:hypothetical protein
MYFSCSHDLGELAGSETSAVLGSAYCYTDTLSNESKVVPLKICRRKGEKDIPHSSFLYLSTRWGWVVSITPRPRVTPGEMTPGTHCTGGWVGPRAGLDTQPTGKIFRLCRGSNLLPGRPARSQTLYWLSYPAHLSSYCNEFAGSISQWKFITLKTQYTIVNYNQ